MNISISRFLTLCGVLVALGGLSNPAYAQPLFFDDFEDRIQDQEFVGNDWTWFDQTFAGDTCSGGPISNWGPWSDGDGTTDYLVENRNYWTASNRFGQGDSYFRAGLEVPAWEGALTKMLRVYGNQYNSATTCERVLVFQERTIEQGGAFVFSFDVAQDQFGAPANGENIAAFVKVIKTSDESFATLTFREIQSTPPVASSPDDVVTARQFIEFNIPQEWVGELLQFGFYNDFSESLGQAWGTTGAYYDNVKLATLDIGPAHSGSFYNESQSGHGFSIEFGYLADGTPLAIVYWYIYDDLGEPIFMVGTGVPDGNRVEIAFDSPVGMAFGVFDPTSVVREDGGTAALVFSDRNNATFSYTPSAFSTSTWGHTTPIVDLPLTKLFGIPADKFFSVED